MRRVDRQTNALPTNQPTNQPMDTAGWGALSLVKTQFQGLMIAVTHNWRLRQVTFNDSSNMQLTIALHSAIMLFSYSPGIKESLPWNQTPKYNNNRERSQSQSVHLSVTFLNSKRFSHYCPTVHDWIAMYPAWFSFPTNFLQFFQMLPTVYRNFLLPTVS